MFPPLTVNHFANTAYFEIELAHEFGDRNAIFVEMPHKNNSLVLESVSRTSLAAIVPVFFNTILHVVLPRPRLKMCRIYARTVVAFVHDIMTFWNRPNVMLVGKTVNAYNLSGKECAVTSGSFCASPNPAASKLWSMCWNWAVLVGFIKQSFNRWFIHRNEKPTTPKVNPASVGGNRSDGSKCSLFVDTYFLTPIQSATTA